MSKKDEADRKFDTFGLPEPKYYPPMPKMMPTQSETCHHRIADARNERVQSGYICIDCGALFQAADHFTQQDQEPILSVDWSRKENQAHALQQIGAYWYDGAVRNQQIADSCYLLANIITEMKNKQ